MLSAADVLGDRWTLLILRTALYGVRRFDDFQTELGTPRTILSGRLKSLVETGLLARRTYKVEGRRARPEYVLTDKGEALRPVLIALTQWGDAWLDSDGQPPISFTDMQSRQAVRTAFVTEEGREVPVENMRIVLRRQV